MSRNYGRSSGGGYGGGRNKRSYRAGDGLSDNRNSRKGGSYGGGYDNRGSGGNQSYDSYYGQGGYENYDSNDGYGGYYDGGYEYDYSYDGYRQSGDGYGYDNSGYGQGRGDYDQYGQGYENYGEGSYDYGEGGYEDYGNNGDYSYGNGESDYWGSKKNNQYGRNNNSGKGDSQDYWGYEGYQKQGKWESYDGGYDNAYSGGGYGENGQQDDVDPDTEYPEQDFDAYSLRQKQALGLRKGAYKVSAEDDLRNFSVHVINDKLKEIGQNHSKRDLVNKVINVTLHVLQDCADVLSKPEPAKAEPEKKEESDATEAFPDDEKKVVEPDQVLLGVVRVGAAKKKILVDIPWEIGDELVVLTKEKPNRPLLEKIYAYVKQHVQDKLKESVLHAEVELNANDTITISLITADPQYKVIIRFSSPQYSQGLADEQVLSVTVTEDLLLNEEDCRASLTKIRQIRWFDNMVSYKLEAPIIRLFLYLKTKIPGFKALTLKVIEVLVAQCTVQLGEDTNRYSVLATCLQALASGILLPGSLGLACPYDAIDLADTFTVQQREDITVAAQSSIRVLVLHGIEKLLY